MSKSSSSNREASSIEAVNTYFKQSEAIEDALNSSEKVPKTVFSFEIDLQGRRKFLVTSVRNFYCFYSKLNQRNYYEVIPDGSLSKLYFDLEYQRDFNSDRDGHLMTRLFIKRVNENIYSEFKIKNSFEDVLILESSSTRKFSVHLIFTEVVFMNNKSCGFFVRRMINNFSEDDHRNFEIVMKDGSKSSFVDLSVYSKNRNLRLYRSMKIGKAIPFLVSKIDTFTKKLLYSPMKKTSDFDMDFQIFKTSLVTFTSEARNQPINEDHIISNQETSNVSRKLESSFSSSSLPSPFPEVDDFFQRIVSPGAISSWQYCGQRKTYKFETVNYRFCLKVNRRHRHNNIYFVLWLDEFVFRQGCHSPQCRGYYSDSTPLPPYLLNWMDDMEECNI